MSLCPRLPDSLRRLAWLDLDGEAGQEYWAAMQLMGRYASANHELIHAHVLKTLGARELTHVENHHNFAWKEEHDGESVIVHRKGATPADAGRLGIVPGSMCSPAFIVRGKGCEEALCSCSHGAGRIMSRAAAFRQLKRADMDALLKENGVELLSAGLDEAPMVYKDIHAVMAAQRDLVDILATFRPRLVKMVSGRTAPQAALIPGRTGPRLRRRVSSAQESFLQIAFACGNLHGHCLLLCLVPDIVAFRPIRCAAQEADPAQPHFPAPDYPEPAVRPPSHPGLAPGFQELATCRSLSTEYGTASSTTTGAPVSPPAAGLDLALFDQFNEGNPARIFLSERGFLVFSPDAPLLWALWKHFDKVASESCGKCSPCRAARRCCATLWPTPAATVM